MYEYPFGNGQQLNLDWFLSEWKNLLAAWEAEKNGIEGALQAEIDRAEAALADVFAARDAAAQSAANALESKNAAAQSASDASGYLATVRADANTASNAAQNAAQSESNAADSAQTAVASKNAAGQSERNAVQCEANALAYKDAAAQSAADALANKNAAAQSAADALANKNAAAQSAEDAEDAASSVETSAQQIATNTSDISNLKESTNELKTAINNPITGLDSKAPVIVETASGELAHITDGANDMPVKALTINGADSATVTRTGKNLMSLSTIELGGTNPRTKSESIGTIPPGTYRFSAVNSDTLTGTIDFGIQFFNKNVQVGQLDPRLGYVTLTDTANRAYAYMASGDYSEGKTLILSNIQLELGSTASAYEPYQSNTFAYPSEIVTTLLGVNNIWSDAGPVDVSYCADTKLYIDNKITELQALVLENIGG